MAYSQYSKEMLVTESNPMARYSEFARRRPIRYVELLSLRALPDRYQTCFLKQNSVPTVSDPGGHPTGYIKGGILRAATE